MRNQSNVFTKAIDLEIAFQRRDPNLMYVLRHLRDFVQREIILYKLQDKNSSRREYYIKNESAKTPMEDSTIGEVFKNARTGRMREYKFNREFEKDWCERKWAAGEEKYTHKYLNDEFLKYMDDSIGFDSTVEDIILYLFSDTRIIEFIMEEVC